MAGGSTRGNWPQDLFCVVRCDAMRKTSMTMKPLRLQNANAQTTGNELKRSQKPDSEKTVGTVMAGTNSYEENA
jgi:hypothetical protein